MTSLPHLQDPEAMVRRALRALHVPKGPVAVATNLSPLAEASRLATLERARRLRLQNDKFEASLISRAQVEKDIFGAARVMRDAILGLPSRLAAEIAAESHPDRVFALLDTELRRALNSAADLLKKYAAADGAVSASTNSRSVGT